MEWSGEGYVLSTRKHGETSAIIEVFTRDRGRYLGLVRGGVSRRLRPILQPGNRIKLEWRARLEEHLGYFQIEAVSSHAAELMNDRLSLAGLNAACAMTREALPEREPHSDVYDALDILIQNLHDIDLWPALYVQWEAGLLSSMGYGLDLSRCAATGHIENLTHVSPRSGRAVCAEAAEPYLDRLYALPSFMQPGNRRNDRALQPDDIHKGLALTGYFLETRLQWGVNKTLPEARDRLVQALTKIKN